MIELNRCSVAIKKLFIKRSATELSTTTKHGDMKNVDVNADNMSPKYFIHTNCKNEQKHFKINVQCSKLLLTNLHE